MITVLGIVEILVLIAFIIVTIFIHRKIIGIIILFGLLAIMMSLTFAIT